jgi:hypothetical protein
LSNDDLDLEDVRSTLLEIVTHGLANRPDGVHLTYVGAEFAKRKNVAFEQYLNILAVQGKVALPPSSRKMVPFIERFCSDLFDIKHPKTGTELLQLRPAADRQSDPVAALPNHKYKKGVWAAFIRPLATDYRRFLNMENLGFTDVKRKPPGEVWLEIKREFISETPIDEPIDGPLVQGRISDWALSNHVDLDALIDSSPSASFDRKRPSVRDLVRIIKAMPPEVAAKWEIPAEVLLHLEVGRD